MEQYEPSLKGVNQAKPPDWSPPHHGWIYRRAVLPVLALLRMGASPRQLAWSVSVGLLIGINPLLGSTTIFCLAVAFLFRLNIAASQIGNHIVYPLQLLLFLPFLHLGTKVFHTRPLPLSRAAIVQTARQHPAELIRSLWLWEWHALVLWLMISVVLLPLLAITLTPLLGKVMKRVRRPRHPQHPAVG